MEPDLISDGECGGEDHGAHADAMIAGESAVDFKLAAERAGHTVVIYSKKCVKDKAQIMVVTDAHCVGKDWSPSELCEAIRVRLKLVGHACLPEHRKIRESKGLVRALRARAVDLRQQLLDVVRRIA